MYGSDILCGISKDTFEIPHNISPILHIHWTMQFLYTTENLGADRL